VVARSSLTSALVRLVPQQVPDIVLVPCLAHQHWSRCADRRKQFTYVLHERGNLYPHAQRYVSASSAFILTHRADEHLGAVNGLIYLFTRQYSLRLSLRRHVC